MIGVGAGVTGVGVTGTGVAMGTAVGRTVGLVAGVAGTAGVGVGVLATRGGVRRPPPPPPLAGGLATTSVVTVTEAAVPAPMMFSALNWKVKVAPALRPVTVVEVADPPPRISVQALPSCCNS